MKTLLRIYDANTGKIEDKEFKTTDAAFKAYWELSEASPPNIEVELITAG